MLNGQIQKSEFDVFIKGGKNKVPSFIFVGAYYLPNSHPVIDNIIIVGAPVCLTISQPLEPQTRQHEREEKKVGNPILVS